MFATPLVLGLAFASSLGSGPERLDTLDRLMSALRAGAGVRIVIDYSRTVLVSEDDPEKERRGPAAIGGMTVSNFEWFDRGVVRNPRAYVALSETHLIAHPSYGHVFNYVRLRIDEEGGVEITAQYLRPTSFEVVMNETFRGRLAGEGKEGAVSVFRIP